MTIKTGQIRIFAMLLLSGIAAAGVASPPAMAIDAPTVARAVEPSLVRIVLEAPDGISGSAGSGIVLNDTGQIVTNYHVVASHIEVGWHLYVIASGASPADDVERHAATIVDYWPGEDLAIIQVPDLERPPAVLSGGDISIPTQGTTLFAFGYPGVATRIGGAEKSSFTTGLSNRLFDGAWTKDGPQIRIIQHSATTNPGNSGGPIVNPCGQVVGINTERELAMLLGPGGIPILLDIIQGVYFASHISVLIAKLDANGIAYTVSPKPCRVILGIATTDAELYLALAAVVIVAFAALLIFIAARVRGEPAHIIVLNGLRPWRRHPQVWHLRYTDQNDKPVELTIRRRDLVDASQDVLIGCDPDCACPVDGDGVARHHALFVPLGRDLAVTPLSADHPIVVDDRPVLSQQNPVRLRPGARLQLGKTLLNVDH